MPTGVRHRLASSETYRSIAGIQKFPKWPCDCICSFNSLLDRRALGILSTFWKDEAPALENHTIRVYEKAAPPCPCEVSLPCHPRCLGLSYWEPDSEPARAPPHWPCFRTQDKPWVILALRMWGDWLSVRASGGVGHVKIAKRLGQP